MPIQRMQTPGFALKKEGMAHTCPVIVSPRYLGLFLIALGAVLTGEPASGVPCPSRHSRGEGPPGDPRHVERALTPHVV